MKLTLDQMRVLLDKSEKSKRKFKEERETVISNQGEIIEQRFQESFLAEREPDFVKLYIDTILIVNGLPNGLKSTLNVLLKHMTYSNIIILNAFIKKQIAKELNYKNVQSLNNNISKLTEGNILIRKGSGTYQVNPFLFGKGKWEDVKNIRLELVFGEEGIQQKANVEYKEENDQS